MDKGDDYFEIYSTKLIFNNESSGTLHFEKDQVDPINFSFDTVNFVEWVEGSPTMPNHGTTLEVPRYLLSNKKIGHIEFFKGVKNNLNVIPEIEKAGHIKHQAPGQAGQLRGKSDSCSESTGIQHLEPETSCYPLLEKLLSFYLGHQNLGCPKHCQIFGYSR